MTWEEELWRDVRALETSDPEPVYVESDWRYACKVRNPVRGKEVTCYSLRHGTHSATVHTVVETAKGLVSLLDRAGVIDIPHRVLQLGFGEEYATIIKFLVPTATGLLQRFIDADKARLMESHQRKLELESARRDLDRVLRIALERGVPLEEIWALADRLAVEEVMRA